jgi:tRNA modification GTPase
MKFVPQSYQFDDTIAAITTPPGEGGVAIIRLSGAHAIEIANRIFSGPVHRYQSHTVHFGRIHTLENIHVDDVLLLVMLGSRSYTGETIVEIHCHGGSLITRRVLATVLTAGARAALPGEFTFRAFINNKIDLTQAEAIQSVICAKNELALDAAENQLRGSLSNTIKKLQHELTHLCAILEAWVDFPEEGLEFTTLEEIHQNLEKTCQQMTRLIESFHDGRILHEGISLCLVGRPNVGKSSLMNALLKKERAIVSPIPGTTRDIVEDQLTLNGLHIKISDTAGIRETSERVELEGIRRSKIALKEADLVLLILDASQGFTDEDQQLFTLVPITKTIVIWNKIDLPHENFPLLSSHFTVELSAKEHKGLENLHKTIDHLIWQKGPPSKEEVFITQLRHKEALQEALQAIYRVQQALQENVSPEFLILDMRQALHELGKIIGTNVTEDVLSEIFSTFCIGK